MKEKGTIHNMTALPRPIVAETGNKQLVKILALGDVEGYSPSCWVVNENGEIDLESVCNPDCSRISNFERSAHGTCPWKQNGNADANEEVKHESRDKSSIG